MPGPGQIRHARLPALRRPRVGLRQRHERPRRHGLPHQLRLHLDRRRPGLASASTTRRAALTAIRTAGTGNDPRWLQVVEGGPAVIGSWRADATAWTAAPVTDHDQTGELRPLERVLGATPREFSHLPPRWQSPGHRLPERAVALRKCHPPFATQVRLVLRAYQAGHADPLLSTELVIRRRFSAHSLF